MEHLLQVFKVSSDKTRLRIIVLLKQQKLCVYEICEILDLPQSRVSKHLTKLRDLNFVVGERIEQYIFYKLHLIDPVLCHLIDEIIANIDNYPQLIKDQENLSERESFRINDKNISIKK